MKMGMNFKMRIVKMDNMLTKEGKEEDERGI